MKIFCQHGFYTFTPETMDDQAYFEAATGYKLVRFGDRLTFAPLAALSGVSICGQDFGGLTAKVNYCGTAAEVMRSNGFVFDLKTQKLAALESVTQTAELYPQINGALIALEDLPQAGAMYERKRLLSFAGVARFNNRQFVLRTYELQDQSI